MVNGQAGKGGADYNDGAAGGARQQASRDDPVEWPVGCCEDGCTFRCKSPQALVTHHCAKHGGAPFTQQESGADEWRAKQRRSTDAVAKATGKRPGQPGWHAGNHIGAGRRTRGAR